MIELNDIKADQGDFLLQVDQLRLRENDFVAILGNNGSGKSTFLSILSGLKEYSGSYNIRQKDFQSVDVVERHRQIGLLPQATTLNMPFDVFYVVLTGRFPHTDGNRYAEVDVASTKRVIEKFDIAHLKNRQFNELSGGEKQRVLLARMINRDAPIILLDEPLSGIDIKHQFEILRFLKALSRDRIILVAIHDISLAVREFDRFLFFEKGSLSYDVPKEALKEDRLSDIFSVQVKFLKHDKGFFVYINEGSHETR